MLKNIIKTSSLTKLDKTEFTCYTKNVLSLRGAVKGVCRASFIVNITKKHTSTFTDKNFVFVNNKFTKELLTNGKVANIINLLLGLIDWMQ